jgi:hypothetical protein
MADQRKDQPPAWANPQTAAKPQTAAPKAEKKPDKTAHKPKEPSYSLYDTGSGKKLLSGVSRTEAANEKTRRKNQESRDSRLEAN